MSNLHKSILIGLLFFLYTPYVLGWLQYQNAEMVIANITDQTDSDIEDVLSIFEFDMDCMTLPNNSDYYKAGLRTLKKIPYYLYY